jgi:hypothetical protein
LSFPFAICPDVLVPEMRFVEIERRTQQAVVKVQIA